uniref:Uncharacterized protein n=1 Tax=Parascaris equorum TaxID=6256 RepID=A0A914R2G9_PAREQ
MGEHESIHNFAGIITRPQSSHLAIGHTEKKLVPSGDGGFCVTDVRGLEV